MMVGDLASLPRWSVEILRFAAMVAIALTVATVYTARGDNHDTTFYACLYAGSFTQINTSGPPSCGRGQQVSWNSQGVQGLPGIDGISGYETVETELPVVVDPGSFAVTWATCPEGKVALGGGAYLADIGLVMLESHPDGKTWNVYMANPTTDEKEFHVRATCAIVAPEN